MPAGSSRLSPCRMRQSRLGSGSTSSGRSAESSAITASQSRSSVSRTAAALRSTPNRFRWRMRRRHALRSEPAREATAERCSRAPRRKAPEPAAGSSSVTPSSSATASGAPSASRCSATSSDHPGAAGNEGDERRVQHRPHQRRRRVVGPGRAARVRCHDAFEHPSQHVRRDAAGARPFRRRRSDTARTADRRRRAIPCWRCHPGARARAGAARTGRR